MEAVIKPKKWKKKLSKADKVYYGITYSVLILLAIIIVYPMYFIVIASISSPDAIFNGEVIFWPKGIDFVGYSRLINEPDIWVGYRNTIIYTVSSTAISILFTIPAGWALSRPELPFRRGFMWIFIVTMFFGGGLIPFYMLMSQLQLVGNPLSVILPGAVSVWNMFMCKAFYSSSVPKELLEAAQLDGAGHFRIFLTIVVPLSRPIIAVMVLFYAVGQWNSYFGAMIFLSDERQFPLQLILREILILTETANSSASAETILEQSKLANQIKYSSIIVASLPVMLLYPFVQKFFDKGILVGTFK